MPLPSGPRGPVSHWRPPTPTQPPCGAYLARGARLWDDLLADVQVERAVDHAHLGLLFDPEAIPQLLEACRGRKRARVREAAFTGSARGPC